MNKVALELKNISISFENNLVLDNLSYSFQKNNTYTLMGANGSGKTTLFNIISGF